jgi:hypothetical protein
MCRSPSERTTIQPETGLLTRGLAFPPVGVCGLPAFAVTARPYSLPLTVAGQWRLCTAFPYIPDLLVLIVKYRAGGRDRPLTAGPRGNQVEYTNFGLSKAVEGNVGGESRRLRCDATGLELVPL